MFLLPHFSQAQEKLISVKGYISDHAGENLPGVSISLENTHFGTISDAAGKYELEGIRAGKYTLVVSAIGYIKQTKGLHLESGKPQTLDFVLEEDNLQLQEVVVEGKSESRILTEKGFSIQAIETQKIRNQSLELNRVLDRSAGVRVRQSGGMGSDFAYSLDGMSGNSIRFLIDGIPVDFFGSVYNINNLPVSLTSRIEVYKGVVPVYLASDALGGAVNIVTVNKARDFLDASYSFGSFNSHRAALQGQWSNARSGLTARLSMFYNYSDNNYKVWGKTVTYYDEATDYRPVEFTRKNPAIRFNDDYRAALIKVEAGFAEKAWADQLFLGFLTSDVNRGVQHGQTMAYVYGDMRYQEQFYMPNLKYIKHDFVTKGLDVKLFSSYAITNATSVDTSIYNYNWRGDVVSIDLDGGERRAQKSLFQLWDKAFMSSLNSNYKISDNMSLAFNFLLKDINRTGADDFAPYHTIPFTRPQSLQTSFTGLSVNNVFFNERLKTDLFIKHYGYHAAVTAEHYTTDKTEDNIIEVVNKQGNWGGGAAVAFQIRKKELLKFSIENAVRLPDAREALGDGVNILNSPYIRPEKSLNLNFGLILGKYALSEKGSLKFSTVAFYRDTKDLIYPSISGGRGEIMFENINKILGRGVEMEVNYDHSWLDFTYNITYLDLRNNEPVSKYGVKNVVYWDRLRNAPFFLSNAGLSIKKQNLIQKESSGFFYCQAGYVHEYYLGWPSLGSNSSKSIIPTQFVFDVGLSYTLPANFLTLAMDASNIFNRQVYDNFLLQKPGRAFSVKLSYRMNKS